MNDDKLPPLPRPTPMSMVARSSDVQYTTHQVRDIQRAAFEAGRLAEREEIAQMFDAEQERRPEFAIIAQRAATVIRARK